MISRNSTSQPNNLLLFKTTDCLPHASFKRTVLPY